MLETLNKLFGEQLKLSPDMWAILLAVVVAVAFIVALVVGLLCGSFKKIKSLMKASTRNPSVVVAQMKKMPASVKALYKNARMSNIKPSSLVTEQVCVEQPYKHSLISKIWLVTLVATVISAALAFVVIPIAPAAEDAVVSGAVGVYSATALVLILGGLLTLVGAIIGAVVHGGAVKAYDKFAAVIDGDNQADTHQAAQAYSEPQQVYAEPQQAYNAQPQDDFGAQQAYEPQQHDDFGTQQVYAEPQQAYAAQPQDDFGTQQAYAAEPVMATQQESEEETRRRAREEALAQMRAQQAAQQQAQTAQQQAGMSSADDVIARIEQIDREGAPRETMREVATLLQKERAKPENKTPEQQRRLNEALSKLLKAMSAASKK